MANTIQHKRGTEAEWTSADPTLPAGQVGVETDTGKFKVGDGSSDSYGYVTMGYNTSYAMSNQYEKLAYAADGNSANVGTLTITGVSSTNTSSPQTATLSEVI